MRRRRILQSFLAVPVAAAAAQAPATPQAPADELPKLAVASIEAGAGGLPGFFTPAQFAALRKLSDTIVPGIDGRPAASQAGVPEFLDFLIRESPANVQELYRSGLDRLAHEGVTPEALAPLRAAWTYDGPPDPFAQFLLRAKADILQAVMSSREWADAQGRGRRGSAPSGYFWRSLD